MDRILIIEKDCDLMQRASYGNQAKVHNGYHYPRSILTARRSRVNFSKAEMALVQVPEAIEVIQKYAAL